MIDLYAPEQPAGDQPQNVQDGCYFGLVTNEAMIFINGSV